MGTKTYTLMAGLMCLALGACTSTDRNMGSSGGEKYGSAATDTSPSQAMTAYGVVQAIDMVPRSQLSSSGASASQSDSMASGSMASQSGSSGTAGSASSSNMVYRITLRLDDGSSRAVMQETQPSVQIGDRVRVANGRLQRQ